MPNFKVSSLDHVAVRVKDMTASVAWYQRIFGLTLYQLPEWGNVPVFLLAGKSGIALFPANLEDVPNNKESKNVKIDHFAFRISNADFEKAKGHFDDLGLEYSLQDHHYFQSLYTRDPDGHVVELTTLVVPEDGFYALGVEAK